MPDRLDVKVVTPSGEKVAIEAASLTAHSDLGAFCILPDHRPILTALVAGQMIVEHTDGTKVPFAIDRGYLEGGIDHINILTEHCVPEDQVDVDALKTRITEIQSLYKELAWDAFERQELDLEFAWLRAQAELVELKIEL